MKILIIPSEVPDDLENFIGQCKLTYDYESNIIILTRGDFKLIIKDYDIEYPPNYIRTCTCGKTFKSLHKTKKYCSRHCRNRENMAATRKRKRT